VKRGFSNIEEFVREKLSFLAPPPADDWAAFEQKLKRALFFRRLKFMGGLVTLLSLLFFSHQWLNAPKDSEPTLTRTKAISIVKADKLDLVQNSGESFPLLSPKPIPLAHFSSPAEPVEESLMADESKDLSVKEENQVLPTSQVEVSPILNQLQTPQARSIKDIPQRRFAPVLDLPAHFMAIRDPNFQITKKRTGPYISPLQERKPWSYSLNIYPNFAFRKFSVDPAKRNLLHSDFIDAMEESERSGFSLNLGLEVSRRIGPITYLNTGLEYITNSYEANFDFINFRNANIDPLSGEILDYQLRKDPKRIISNELNTYHYLNLPLSISHQPWVSNHLRLNFEAGFSLLYFLRAEGQSIDYTSLELIELSDRNYRSFIGSAALKLGVQYYVSPRMNIGFEPTFLYFTNTIYSQSYPFRVVPYSLGINFNIQFKLN
jgi:hypothetical protein